MGKPVAVRMRLLSEQERGLVHAVDAIVAGLCDAGHGWKRDEPVGGQEDFVRLDVGGDPAWPTCDAGCARRRLHTDETIILEPLPPVFIPGATGKDDDRVTGQA